MGTITLVTLAMVGIGIGALGLGLARLWHRRLLAGGSHCLMGAALVGLGALSSAVGLNLYTYSRLTYEQPVGSIRFIETAPQAYTALVGVPGSPVVQRYPLYGDAWQMDARILKWDGPAVIAGLDSAYRLERLGGRYRDIESERNLPRTVHDLAPQRGLDLWALAADSGWLPWVDTVYGSAAYLPMTDGARFTVSLTQTGLVARPANRQAEQITRNWN